MSEFADFSIGLGPLEPNSMIESLHGDGSGLRIVFRKTADRFAHAIALVPPRDSGQPLRWLARSLEGLPGDGLVWPPSPPLQDLSIEHRESSSVALAVGMAGKSHWSFSAEAQTGKGEVAFDIACRLGGSEPSLGSRYETCEDLEVMTRIAERSAEIEVDGRFFRFQVELGEAPQMGFEDLTLPVMVPPGAKSVRWKYSLRFV